jgi:uncharacterized UBP type Zn finger protein
VFKLKPLVQVKLIGKQFKGGRQEDAHEFLIHLLDAMQAGCADDIAWLW